MSINRRALLQAALGAGFSPAAFASSEEPHSEPKKDCYVEDKSSALKTTAENWQALRHVPPAFRNKEVFWGYPVRSQNDVSLMPPQMVATAFSLYTAATEDKFLSVTTGKQQAFCENPERTHTRFEATFPRDPELDKAAYSLMQTFGRIPHELKKLKGQTRFLQILFNLANIYRSPLYEVHTDWLGVPKTPLQLVTDRKGDCKDFALARYMTARFMGVKAEHAMMIQYVDGKRDSMVGHANMAIYNEHFGWVIVDGTGRHEDEDRGGSILFSNDRRVKDSMDGYLSTMIPIMMITSEGIAQVDSLWGRSSLGFANFKPPQPLPQTAGKYIFEIYDKEMTFQPPTAPGGP